MITIVVGAQYGGEGKGKVCAYLSYKEGVDLACRCGGPNSSHTVVNGNTEFRLRMMPAAAAINNRVDVYFGAGTLIHIATLENEIQQLNYQGRIIIDPRAGIITDDIVEEQRADDRYSSIGSTLTGTGLAIALRAQRKLKLASEFKELKSYITDEYLHQALRSKRKIIIEGHQGFGLSNYHGDYPYTSSRDSTAPAMLSELGIGLKPGMRIILVAKLFPTRNHAGFLGEEISKSDRKTLGIEEYGGGSWGIPDRERRVALFDLAIVRRAIFANSPTEIALTGADYFDHEVRGSLCWRDSGNISDFVKDFRRQVAQPPIRYISTGRDTNAMMELPVLSKSARNKQKVEERDLFSS